MKKNLLLDYACNIKEKKILQALAVWDMLQHVNNNSVQCKHNVKGLCVAFLHSFST